VPAAASGNEDLEACVANANAVDLLLALGLQPEPAGMLAFEAFSGLVTAALRRHLGYRSPSLPAEDDVEPGKMTVTFAGCAECYIERRLGELAVVIQRSRPFNPTHFGWD
jgi:hypothetical protein